MKALVPTISVVMPFYNCERFLDQSILSILDQTYTDFEFIIIDDASTDNSDEIVRRYQERDERIIFVKNERNIGIVENLNRGIQMARGKYIARMDGDDISTVDRFEKQLHIFHENPDVSIVSGWVQIIDADGVLGSILEKPTDPEEIRNRLFYYFTIPHNCAMIDRHVYDVIGGYRGEYLYVEDVDWSFRAIYGGCIAKNVGEVILYYRRHPESTSRYTRIKCQKSFSLKKEMIQRFGLRLTTGEGLSLYAHYLIGMFLPVRFQEYIFRIFKSFL